MVTQAKQPVKRVKSKPIRKTSRPSDRTPPEERQAKILAYVEQHGASITQAIAKAIGGRPDTTRIHANILCEQQKLHRTRVQRPDGGRDVAFNPGPGPIDAYTAKPAHENSFESSVRPVLKDWPPHHARDPLDCYLFGVPVVLLAVEVAL